jgi:hypothetical protein
MPSRVLIALVLAWGAARWWQATRARANLLRDTHVTVTTLAELSAHLEPSSEWRTTRGIGLDVEWHHRQPNTTDILQLSNGAHTLVVQLHATTAGSLPSALVDLLQDADVPKYGVAVRQDARRLERQYPGLTVRGEVDLARSSSLGLKYLTAHVLGVTLPKEKHLTLSDWSRPMLSDSQVHYAAADAYYSWRLGQVPRSDLTAVPLPVHSALTRAVHPSASLPPISSAARQRPLYENIPLLAQDGRLIAYINTKKQRWYIGRKLATLVLYQGKSPAVQLNFAPRVSVDAAVAAAPFEPEKNVCVVCGKNTATNCHLVRIVPPELQRHLPPEQKLFVQRNTIGVCFGCACAWGLRARAYTRQLAQEAGVVFERPPSNHPLKAASALAADVGRDKIPADLRRDMWETVRIDYPGATPSTLASIASLAQHKARKTLAAANFDFNRRLVAHYALATETANQFVVGWRQHLVASMHPRYLPLSWRADALELRERT